MVTYYEKKGKRYHPILEKDIWSSGDTWNEGCHLVVCKPGIRTVKYNVLPDDSAFIAAQLITAERLASFIVEASAAKASPAPATQEQINAWQALKDSYEGGPYYLQYESAVGIARKFLEMLREIHDRKGDDYSSS